MTPNNETETPRTDALSTKLCINPPGDNLGPILCEHARQLERELSEALEANKRANEAFGNQANENDKIYRQLKSEIETLKQPISTEVQEAMERIVKEIDVHTFHFMTFDGFINDIHTVITHIKKGQ